MTDATGGTAARPRGEIYDLGYRNYDGPRLGRSYALRSLVALSVRNVFGLGRGPLPKVLAFGLATIALVPALLQVAGGALGLSGFEFVSHDEYFGLIQVIIVLFVATMSSELVGNDRRNNTLQLYYARPIARDDYVLAKVASLALALLSLTLVPQLLVFLGNWLGARDSTAWLGDNADQLWRILVASSLTSIQLAAVGVAIAMFTSRRAFALVSVLAALLVSVLATGGLVSLLGAGWAAAVMVASPLFVMNAVALVIFDAVPDRFPGSQEGEIPDQIAYADLPWWVWVVALVAQVAVAVGLAVLRYRRDA